MRWIIAVAATLVLAVAVGGVWLYTRAASTATDPFEPCRASTIAGGADQIGGPFELLNAEGKTVTDEDVITEPTLLYFGYTFCPDVCPLDTVRNADAVDVLKGRGYDAQTVFISIDPERDTPEVVGDFAANISEDMIGLTGSPEQVRAASQTYRTYFKKQPADDEYYLVDHSTFTYLVLPGHGFVEYFRRDMPPEQLAERAACYIDRM
ncbi:MAG: SCO family protein [Rhodobacteraceae bacterium]|jgi:protein SCO1/2|uniref:Protein SCO1/2 n=1 Tax=Salipiger profundus TaxID=1229727 RepID=A0A1U7D3S0_9RHOB|nr:MULTISPECIES: SCO family protein [Salipiger]APX22753.1 protein SCO1/2 [Salipiger profundus]MAB05841.1 SCO family protein [Paracoccaceae bacterium]GGA09924.1 protein senC [Salipiger profundus]SFC61920.1 protein SCO1/2 [Salipiger profundus]